MRCIPSALRRGSVLISRGEHRGLTAPCADHRRQDELVLVLYLPVVGLAHLDGQGHFLFDERLEGGIRSGVGRGGGGRLVGEFDAFCRGRGGAGAGEGHGAAEEGHG